MKLAVFLAAMILTVGDSQGTVTNTITNWVPAGPNDLRGPCPMLNTLANHGFLPHNGRNITKENTIFAMSAALGFFTHPLLCNPDLNAMTFSLRMLRCHNILEHDATLNRQDTYYGNNYIFNQPIFDQTTQYWTAETVTSDMLADSSLSRQLNMKAFNPQYILTTASQRGIFGDLALPVLVFGNISSATVSKGLLVSWFKNERLPTNFGRVKKTKAITLEEIKTMAGLISNGFKTTTDSGSATNAKARRDIGLGHGYFGFAEG